MRKIQPIDKAPPMKDKKLFGMFSKISQTQADMLEVQRKASSPLNQELAKMALGENVLINRSMWLEMDS